MARTKCATISTAKKLMTTDVVDTPRSPCSGLMRITFLSAARRAGRQQGILYQLLNSFGREDK